MARSAPRAKDVSAGFAILAGHEGVLETALKTHVPCDQIVQPKMAYRSGHVPKFGPGQVGNVAFSFPEVKLKAPRYSLPDLWSWRKVRLRPIYPISRYQTPKQENHDGNNR